MSVKGSKENQHLKNLTTSIALERNLGDHQTNEKSLTAIKSNNISEINASDLGTLRSRPSNQFAFLSPRIVIDCPKIDSIVPRHLIPFEMGFKHKDLAKGFVVGAAFNLNLPISRQEMSKVNINGTQKTLFDYLPSVYIQYHFNSKWFVQSELQWINPQYTPNLTLFNRTSFLTANKKQNDVVSLNKLYYLNLPLSIHYSPMPNFYLGLGLQYSYLQHSILNGEQSLFENGPNGWVMTSQTKTIYIKSNTNREVNLQNNRNRNRGNPNNNPGSTSALTPEDNAARSIKTTDWRLLADAGYHWHHFIVGIHFNVGLDNYINMKAGAYNSLIKDRNESFMLYLRYNFLDWRKKKHSSKR
ncbi:MAG: hypothetical protein NVS1B13_22970 [Flavisolibacter sp.]